MSEKELSDITGSEETRERQPELALANPGRRRLGGLGVGGTAVALSVASRSAVAGWGQCTGSELASGNLSRDPNQANPCGCSPGFWWNNNGVAIWDNASILAFTGYRRSNKFNAVFGVNFLSDNNLSMGQVGPGVNPSNTVGANGNTAMHAVAALLNAAYFGTRYPVPGLQTPAAVIAAFQAAFNTVGGGNARKQAFADFVTRVDVYTSKSTWCQGTKH
jgi:hypothetical protein